MTHHITDEQIGQIAEQVGLIGPASRVGDCHAASLRFARALLTIAAPAPAVPSDEYEVRKDGVTVRKDRWEVGIRRIVALLWGNRYSFEVDEVVEAVRALIPEPHDDDEALVHGVLGLTAAPTPPAQPSTQPVRLSDVQRVLAEVGLDLTLTARAPGTTQPAQSEPVQLGELAKRNVYDAIRGAYDLGYNDARNARAVPGDSAPGYDGRNVEADHGGALINSLNQRLRSATAQPAVPEDVAREPMTQRWCWWIGDAETFHIADTESEAHGEAQCRIDDDCEPGDTREYSVGRVQHPIDALGVDWLAEHVAETIEENTREWCDDNTGAEDQSITLAAEDRKLLGTMVATFLRERAAVHWWTADQKTITTHTYVAGSSDDADAARAAEKGGA